MADTYATRLKQLIDSAQDKDAVKTSIGARLYANSTMMGNQARLPTSSKDAEINTIIAEFEGDAEMSSDVEDALKKIGGRRRRKTRKSKKSRRGGVDEDPSNPIQQPTGANSIPATNPVNVPSIGPDPPVRRPRISSTGTMIAEDGGRRRRRTTRKLRKSRTYSRRR